MSIYAERFESSSIKAFLKATIAELDAIDLAELGSDYRDIAVRAKHIATTVSDRISDVDPELLTESIIEELRSTTQHLANTARHCRAQGSWSELSRFSDGVLQAFAQIPVTWRPDKSLKSTNLDLSKYKKEVGTALADANAALEKLANATASVNERVAAMEQCTLASTTELDTRIGAVSKEIENLEASRAELSEDLVQAKDELDELHHATKALVDQLEADAKEHERARQARLDESLRIQESQWGTLKGQFESTFTSHINQWSTDANNAANARQSQFSAELDRFKSLLASLQAEHIRSWEELAALWGKTFSELETEQQRAHSDSRAEASRAFQSLGEQFTSESNELLELLKRRAEATMDDYSRQGAELISSLTEKDVQARTLVELIGNTAVTGKYQTIANRELKSANWMRGFSIGAIILLVILALYDITQADSANLGWELMVFRLSVGLPLVGLAWYCGRESSRHRSNEERNRRLELELTALSPYLEQLPEPKAQEIRGQLTERYFGNESGRERENSGNPDQITVGKLLTVLEPVVALLKKAK